MAPYVRFVRSIFSAFLRRNFLKANHVPTRMDMLVTILSPKQHNVQRATG